MSAGQDGVVVDCPDDPVVLENGETDLPGRFADTRFLDEDGNPMATTVETTAAELGRLVVDVEGEGTTATAPLEATIDGPAVTNHYGPDFAAVVRGLSGPVTLQTGPGEPVAFVQSDPEYTLRFVVADA